MSVLTRFRNSRFLTASLGRRLHLAPPYLLDDHYTPRFAYLTPAQAQEKQARAVKHLQNCNLCPRRCGVNRYKRSGYCLISAQKVTVATIGPHFGEEPSIQGHRGSGSIFFSGCNLRCVFCQNHDIAHQTNGQDLTPEQLAEYCIRLQEYGAHNINFVTPEHVSSQVVMTILCAKDLGLHIPIIYNTSAYDSEESLDLLDGLVDIYLPDFKLWEPESSKRLLKAGDYAETARRSIRSMFDQVGDLCFSSDGIAKKGVLLRHLVMPGRQEEGTKIMQWVAEHVSRDLFVNIMEQYHPGAHVGRPTRSNRSSSNAQLERQPEFKAKDSAQARAVRYADVNRPVDEVETLTVRRSAESFGLWRFSDPPRHGGFNL